MGEKYFLRKEKNSATTEALLQYFYRKIYEIYLLCNKNGKIVYTGGNWGEDSPNGVVKKIMKTGSKTYEVTYNLYFYNWMTKKNYGYMGTYKIYLKKANNKNGFIITNIKQTVNKKNSL